MQLSAEIIDPAALDLIRSLQPESGDELVAHLVSIYLEDAAKHVAAIRRAVVGSDAELLRVAAHTLKSSSAQLGARKLSESCKALEIAARGNDLSSGDRLASDLESEFVRVRAALGQLCSAQAV
ncbi:MAG TPA: Hpt domain-containing protein [Burkholderiales bacterium]|nr:Hpt domain-containing protein [Burkholderiales bacterium]